jgi:hypothetical protein
MRSIKANPGGQLDPGEVIGRDDLIAWLWQTLERQSVWMTAERRSGKTQTMKKMVQAPPEGWEACFLELESVSSPLEFAIRMSREAERHLGRWKTFTRRAGETLKRIEAVGVEGVTLGQSAPGWKELPQDTVADVEAARADQRLLFFLDELPYMLQRIQERQGPQTAQDVLDQLRHLRQTHSSFRIVVSGSIGLHHVLTSLRASGYANAPLNDCDKVDLPPLSAEHARELALGLMVGENLQASDPEASAQRMVEHASAWPYYLHHLAKQLAASAQKRAEPADIDAIVERILVDPNDPLNLRHFRDRLTIYYPTEHALASLVLDALVHANEPLKLDQIERDLRSTGATIERAALRSLLEKMQMDHYVDREPGTGAYRLRLPLFVRWWAQDRGID